MNRASHNQMKKLLELMSEDGILQNGKLVYLPQSNKNIFWRRITMQLNAVEGGVYKNMWKWSKVWADWKNKTKKKADKLAKMGFDFSEPKYPLTNLEYRLLKLIGYPLATKSEQKSESTDNAVNTSAAYFILEHQSDLEDGDAPLNHLEDSKYNEESSDFRLPENNQESEIFMEFDENPVYTKNSREKHCKRKRIDKSLEDLSMDNIDNLDKYKLKIRLSIEKERLRQKREELRLRAIELKIKGDEIRLKEAEMNKINFLTNVEEEKLKCFREIASMLKE
ncbi:hypothetical protein EVAR_22511_1 [Eumeta japonica]|uniref:Regulatory protein zeste n=1 Tax=Eumeta variegata TaxID=151549 RepID=A0A4C1U779_EUMVA|nr:hypothetical protein EVAR_22511_1 [Eumeta japonica]